MARRPSPYLHRQPKVVTHLKALPVLRAEGSCRLSTLVRPDREHVARRLFEVETTPSRKAEDIADNLPTCRDQPLAQRLKIVGIDYDQRLPRSVPRIGVESAFEPAAGDIRVIVAPILEHPSEGCLRNSFVRLSAATLGAGNSTKSICPEVGVFFIREFLSYFLCQKYLRPSMRTVTSPTSSPTPTAAHPAASPPTPEPPPQHRSAQDPRSPRRARSGLPPCARAISRTVGVHPGHSGR